MRLFPPLLAALSLAACGTKSLDCTTTIADYCTQHPTNCPSQTYDDYLERVCPPPAQTGVFVGTCHGFKEIRLESTGINIALFDETSGALVSFAQLDAINSDFACKGGPDSIPDPDCDLTDLTLYCGHNPDI